MIFDHPQVEVLAGNVDAALLRLRGKVNQCRTFVILKQRKMYPSPQARARAKVKEANKRKENRIKKQERRKRNNFNR